LQHNPHYPDFAGTMSRAEIPYSESALDYRVACDDFAW